MLARILKSIQYTNVPPRPYPLQSVIFTQMKWFCEKINESSSNELTNQKTEPDTKLGSFAKAYKEIEQLAEKPNKQPVESVPFKKLLKESNLIDVSSLINQHSILNK